MLARELSGTRVANAQGLQGGEVRGVEVEVFRGKMEEGHDAVGGQVIEGEGYALQVADGQELSEGAFGGEHFMRQADFDDARGCVAAQAAPPVVAV